MSDDVCRYGFAFFVCGRRRASFIHRTSVMPAETAKVELLQAACAVIVF